MPLPTIEDVLTDPACHFWLRDALAAALRLDPVDTANDAELLYALLDQRCKQAAAAATTDGRG